MVTIDQDTQQWMNCPGLALDIATADTSSWESPSKPFVLKARNRHFGWDFQLPKCRFEESL